MKTVLILALLAVVALAAYIRLAPSDPARWNVDPAAAADPGAGGVLARHPAPLPPRDALARFDAIARAEPRTAVLAGGVDDGRITYVVRSKWVGFPDYVTVQAVQSATGSDLTILSRLRFGGSDLGVNKARLDRWLQAFDAVQQ